MDREVNGTRNIFLEQLSTPDVTSNFCERWPKPRLLRRREKSSRSTTRRCTGPAVASTTASRSVCMASFPRPVRVNRDRVGCV